MDHTLVEWLASLSPDLKLNRGEGKYILKKALEPYLPDGILYRPKMGFAVPLTKWFRGPLRQAMKDAVFQANPKNAQPDRRIERPSRCGVS